MKKALSLSLMAFMIVAFVLSESVSVNAESRTTLIYSMEAESRPASADVTSRPSYVSYENLNDGVYNNVLKFLRTSSKDTTQDQAAYFSLPANIYTNYGTPISITFDAKTDTGSVVWNNQVYLSASGTNTVTASLGSLYSFTSTWKTYTISLTSTAAQTAINSNYRTLNFRNAYSSANTCNYFYIDNVKLNYEPTTTQHNVLLDGASKFINEGSAYVFPSSTTTGFIAYTDGENLYKPNESVIVNQDLTFTTLSIGDFNMLNGASMRFNQAAGIRFYTAVNVDKINDLKQQENLKVELGTLIAPSDFLNSYTLDKTLLPQNFVDVRFESSSFYEDTSLNFQGIVGSLVNIKNKNLNRNFTGRGYASVTMNGRTITIYAKYYNNKKDNNQRSLSFISNAIKEDHIYFNTLPTDQQNIVASFIDLAKEAPTFDVIRTINGISYTQTFYDDFEGDTLNFDQWRYSAEGARQNNGCVWRNSMTSLDGNGNLKLSCEYDSSGNVITGSIQTKDLFDQTYGYFEARIKVQSVKGMWSAFWMMPMYNRDYALFDDQIQGGSDGTEIDIYEYVSNNNSGGQNVLQHAIHYDGYGPNHAIVSKNSNTSSAAGVADGNYHTFALEWNEYSYNFYIDGKLSNTINTSTLDNFGNPVAISQVPSYLILSIESGTWCAKPDASKLPDGILVDYVKVYQEVK